MVYNNSQAIVYGYDSHIITIDYPGFTNMVDWWLMPPENSSRATKNTNTVETGYKSTGYKNIPVIRTCFSTPNDVLITSFHCITILSQYGG